jgi:hypothetical protein
MSNENGPDFGKPGNSRAPYPPQPRDGSLVPPDVAEGPAFPPPRGRLTLGESASMSREAPLLQEEPSETPDDDDAPAPGSDPAAPLRQRKRAPIPIAFVGPGVWK